MGTYIEIAAASYDDKRQIIRDAGGISASAHLPLGEDKYVFACLSEGLAFSRVEVLPREQAVVGERQTAGDIRSSSWAIPRSSFDSPLERPYYHLSTVDALAAEVKTDG